MITISHSSMFLLVAFGVFAVLLIVWLIYRNMKDEDEFEESMDDTGQQSNNHIRKDEEKI